MDNEIELIGAAAAGDSSLAGEVARLLSGGKINLSYGADFMGRPATQVYSCERHVVKLRGELSLKAAIARGWCLHALARERRFAVHHPDKTWFLVKRGGADGDVGIGNICPRLTPLHSLLRSPPASQAEREVRLAWLDALLAMDCRLGREASTRLDLGLSNFGLDAEGRIYYLDDDFYSADGWVALAQALGVWLRSYGWMDEAFAAGLGGLLRRRLLHFFEDVHCLTVLAEQLRGLFMPNPEKKGVLGALVGGLAGVASAAVAAPAAAKPQAKPRQRYFALLADVHANLPALEAALEFLARENIRDGIILGDIVGYGPHPVECVERLQDARLGLGLLRGNHDHAAATGICGQGFGASARWCIEWTIPRLAEAHKAWLLALPVFAEGEGWLAVHGAPVDPTFFNAYVYQMTYAQNLDVLAERGIAVCFHGHTHMPGVYTRNKAGIDGFVGERQVSLADWRHCLVCPGSVGQPRNREAGAQLAVLDRDTRQLRFFNLPYAVDGVLKDMEQAGFPQGLTRRLLEGL